MRHNILGFYLLILSPLLPAIQAAEKVLIKEKIDQAIVYQVKLKVDLSGTLQVDRNEEPWKIQGTSSVQFTERFLPQLEDRSTRVIRDYQELKYSRTLKNKEQVGTLRSKVQRLVVLRSPDGKKAPFSPDGPLTWYEIGLVGNDLFLPTVVSGLLPNRVVQEKESWKIQPEALKELTAFESITRDDCQAKLLGIVTVEKRRLAKIQLEGTVEGLAEDGPSRQKLAGIAYFDLLAERLSYLKITGVHELLDEKKSVRGELQGSFTMTRDSTIHFPRLTDDELKKISLEPTINNTLLLHRDEELGIELVFPRRWRVEETQKNQVILRAAGGAVLRLVGGVGGIPTAEQFQKEVLQYLRQSQRTVLKTQPLVSTDLGTQRLQQFTYQVRRGEEIEQLHYALVSRGSHGVTIAAMIPEKHFEVLQGDMKIICNNLTILPNIVKP